jgi:hypothetical protein
MEAKQNQPVQQNVNIETLPSEQLALMLSQEHRNLFLTNQNIQVIENILRTRMSGVRISTSPNQEKEKPKDGSNDGTVSTT